MHFSQYRFARRTVLCILLVLSLGCLHGRQPSDHVNADEKARGPKQTANRLAAETSPYLLMHAHNPVDWYPWGEEALTRARKEGKVIFLSVGYSSCHWCHVMERESFMDDEIAAFMNKHFVCIKVDREERPDVDSIYMTAVQIVSERGGWPMSVFLTPEAKPFFGATYFPARDNDRPGAVGFLTILKRVHELWRTSRARLEADADRVTELIKRQMDGEQRSESTPLPDKLSAAVQSALAEQFDAKHGGFGYVAADPNRPKFPEPSNLMFLAHRARNVTLANSKREEAQRMLVATLDHMARGGIRDHLGGGFHRYSVDRYWRIPHFEKMLYDNGQLAAVYAAGYSLTQRADYRQVVQELIDFVLRELQDEGGAFYAALDAESEGREGEFYVWRKDEIDAALTEQEMRLVSRVYGLDQKPNFEEHFFALQLSAPPADMSASLDLKPETLEQKLAPIRSKLLAIRAKRPRPLTDKKILTAWNGLMIRGLADAGRVLGRDDYTQAASRSAEFILRELRTENGRLLRSYVAGEARFNAYLDDYAFLIDGLIALHRATENQKWLAAADALMKTQLELFRDERRGGFYFTSDDHESLIARSRNPVDGARPAGNSVSARNLIYLAREVNKPEYLAIAEQTIQSVAPLLSRSPHAAPIMALAHDALGERERK